MADTFSSGTITSPFVAAEVGRLEDALFRFCPSRQWQIVQVTFPTTAGTVIDIVHGLTPDRPELIDWAVLQSTAPMIVFQPRDTAFLEGVVMLACTQPGGQAILLLMVSASVSGRSPLLGTVASTSLTSYVPDNFVVEDVALGPIPYSVIPSTPGDLSGLRIRDWIIGTRVAISPSVAGVRELTFWDTSESTTFPILRFFEDTGGDYVICPAENNRTIHLGYNGGTNTENFASVKAVDFYDRERSVPMGDWTSYTPTWTGASTNPTLGNATLGGKYSRVGKTTHFKIRLIIGSTTTVATGIWSFTIPTTADTDFQPLVSGLSVNAGVTNIPLDAVWGSSTTITPMSGIVADGWMTDVYPFAWGTGDALYISGTYEDA